MISIYKLIDPNTKQIRYIGKTMTSLEHRLVSHIYAAHHREYLFDAKGKWLRELMSNYQVPIAELIETTTDSSREKYWIKKLEPDLNTVHGTNDEFNKLYSERKSRPVYQYDLDGNFIQAWKSATEVERILGIESTNIGLVLRGERKKAGDFMWSATFFAAMSHFRRKKSIKTVYQYTIDGEYINTFESAREAAKEGFSYKAISSVCTGRKKTHLGFKFSFVKSLRYSPILEETQDALLQE